MRSSDTPRDNLIHGKKFEKFLNGVFNQFYLRHSVEWRRVIDSGDAGNIIGKADGDFELTVCSGVYGLPYRFRIECKASTVHDSLADNFRSLIKAHQSAKMRLTTRTGICGVYMFHGVQNDEIEIWSARHVDKAHPEKRKKFYGRPAIVVSKENFHIVANDWITNPQTMIDRLVRSETFGE